jgi:hypothetical protein
MAVGGTSLGEVIELAGPLRWPLQRNLSRHVEDRMAATMGAKID